MLNWVLQDMLEEMFQKTDPHNKDRTCLFVKYIYFRNTGI